jgi:hypothetical protein
MDLSCVLPLSFQEKYRTFIVAVSHLKLNAAAQFGHALRSCRPGLEAAESAAQKPQVRDALAKPPVDGA